MGLCDLLAPDRRGDDPASGHQELLGVDAVVALLGAVGFDHAPGGAIDLQRHIQQRDDAVIDQDGRGMIALRRSQVLDDDGLTGLVSAAGRRRQSDREGGGPDDAFAPTRPGLHDQVAGRWPIPQDLDVTDLYGAGYQGDGGVQQTFRRGLGAGEVSKFGQDIRVRADFLQVARTVLFVHVHVLVELGNPRDRLRSHCRRLRSQRPPSRAGRVGSAALRMFVSERRHGRTRDTPSPPDRPRLFHSL